MSIDYGVASVVLHAAADRLGRDGWTQGSLMQGTASCAVGAIRLEADGHVNYNPCGESGAAPFSLLGKQAVAVLREFLHDEGGRYGYGAEEYDGDLYPIENITNWNDTQGRGRAQVIAAFHAASAWASERHAEEESNA